MSKRIQNKKLLAERKALHKQKKARKRNVIILISAICVTAVIVIAIIASLPHYVKIENVNGKYIDDENGITYLAAPQNYEPVSYTQKPYGKLDGNYMYPITGMSTSEWLAEDYYGIFGVYYNENTTLPSLEEFYPTRIQVCRDNSSAVVRMADINDYSDVMHIVNEVLNGKTVAEPNSSTAVYTLRISSSRYTWIYYNVVYIVSNECRYYYDRGTGRCVKADDTVALYLEGTHNEDSQPVTDTEEGNSNETTE